MIRRSLVLFCPRSCRIAPRPGSSSLRCVVTGSVLWRSWPSAASPRRADAGHLSRLRPSSTRRHQRNPGQPDAQGAQGTGAGAGQRVLGEGLLLTAEARLTCDSAVWCNRRFNKAAARLRQRHGRLHGSLPRDPGRWTDPRRAPRDDAPDPGRRWARCSTSIPAPTRHRLVRRCTTPGNFTMLPFIRW